MIQTYSAAITRMKRDIIAGIILPAVKTIMDAVETKISKEA